MVQELKNGDDVAAFIKETSPAVLHFYAAWAPSCEQVNQLLTDFIEDTNLPLRAAYLEAEALPGISLNFQVSAAPTLIFFRNGKEVSRVDGFVPTEIKEKALLATSQGSDGIGSFVAATPSVENPETVKQALYDRLKKLIESHRVMLFMKGNPKEPKCGFSRQIIELLNSKNIDYGSFDIFSDESVRQGLKEYSNWPTFPQLYFDGELVGGLDVVKEEFADESFVAKLPTTTDKKAKLEERLVSLIKKQRMTLFMKGNRDQPKCGFSRTIVQLLNDAKADYGTFDILSDEEVRQGLKEYSNWPTFPQLYLDGELIGGLDVVKEELLDTQFLRSIPRVGRD